MVRESRPVPVLLRLVVVGVVLACAACGGPVRKPTYRVTGKVLFEGRPAVNATVILHPEDKSKEVPRGVVGADGSFQLTTYKYLDGAPAGRYGVTIIWTEKTGGGDDADVKDLLPARYGDPTTSGYTVEVRQEATNFPTFELTG
jgi:hypothetical protein